MCMDEGLPEALFTEFGQETLSNAALSMVPFFRARSSNLAIQIASTW